jgi:hypothetical protein
MMQLVWWSLAEYDHVPVVSAARKGMCKQMTELMLSQWHRNGHICKTLTSFTAYHLQRYDSTMIMKLSVHSQKQRNTSALIYIYDVLTNNAVYCVGCYGIRISCRVVSCRQAKISLPRRMQRSVLAQSSITGGH